MSSRFFPLGRTHGVSGIFLKELDGHAEMKITDTGTQSVLELLNDIMISKMPDGSPLSPGDIPIADRDQILADVYLSLYGSRIETTVSCAYCDDFFDFRFSLDELIDHITDRDSTLEVSLCEDGNYELPGGIVFRLPTGKDELAIMGHSTGQKEKILLDRCIIKGEEKAEKDIIEDAMTQVAPMLDTTLSATCPLCNGAQSFQFDIQPFLLSKLIMERKELIRQMHQLASAYKWGHKEIMDLPRQQRQQYCAFIDFEKGNN